MEHVRNEIDGLVRQAVAAQECASVSDLARRWKIPLRTIAGWQMLGKISADRDRLVLEMLAAGLWKLPTPEAQSGKSSDA